MARRWLVPVVGIAAIIVAGWVLVGRSPSPTAPTGANSGGPPVATQPARASRAEERSLYAAVDRDDLQAARRLLAARPQVARAHSGDQGETPLHHARSVAMAQLLVDAGADLRARDKAAQATPARWAASEWRRDVAAFLETRGGGDSDIFYYAATGNVEKLAAELKANPQRLNERAPRPDALGDGQHLLHLAAQYGQTAVCQLLLDSGADVNVRGGWHDSEPLEHAAWAGFPDTVQLLLSRGADVDARGDDSVHPALWYAALTGRREVVASLLEAGATIEPGLIAEVRKTEHAPYPSRTLPPRDQFDAVIELLKKHGAEE